MNEVNFLPQDWVRAKERKGRLGAEMTLVAVVALGLFAAWFGGHRRVAAIDADVELRRNDLAIMRNQVDELKRLEKEHADLARQIQVQRRLSPAVTYASAMATVSEQMSPSLALTRLAMVSDMPTPRARGARVVNDNRTLRMEMAGLSPEDVETAGFVGKLSDHPLFNDVKMRYSRAMRVGNLEARQFRIEMEIPLNRIYRPAVRQPRASTKGTDHAG